MTRSLSTCFLLFLLTFIPLHSVEFKRFSAIDSWCASFEAPENQLFNLQAYINEVLSWAISCNNDSNFMNTHNGEVAQDHIDVVVHLMLDDKILKAVYKNFEEAVKTILDSEDFVFSENYKTQYGYELLIKIYTQALECVEKKRENNSN